MGTELDDFIATGTRVAMSVAFDVEARRKANLVYVAGYWDGCGSLGYDMLMLYLQGARSAPPAILQRLQAAIIGSNVYDRLQHELDLEIRSESELKRRALSSSEILDISRRFVRDYRRRRNPDTGLDPTYFLPDDHGLQIVIGGLSELTVAAAGSRFGRYEVLLTFEDTYDFDNNRTFNRPYHALRESLLSHLRAGEYVAFWNSYATAWNNGDYTQWPDCAPSPHLSKAHVFASFMYAVEKAGFTGPGVKWRVDVPVRGSMPFGGSQSCLDARQPAAVRLGFEQRDFSIQQFFGKETAQPIRTLPPDRPVRTGAPDGGWRRP